MVHAIFFSPRFEISSDVFVLWWDSNVSLTVFLNCTETLRFSFFNVLDIVCTKTRWVSLFHAGLSGSLLPPPIFPAAYFHGNKSITPDIYSCQTHTTTLHSRRNTEACGSFQSRTRGIKKKKKTGMDVGFINMEEDHRIWTWTGRLIRTLDVSLRPPR